MAVSSIYCVEGYKLSTWQLPKAVKNLAKP